MSILLAESPLVQLVQFLWNGIDIIVPVAAALGGWYLGRYRSNSKWKKREFFDRINISLNSIEHGHLRIRTLVEKHLDEVFLNSAARDTVLCKAQQTSPEDSILPLEEDEYWYCLNPVLNEISERFAEGHLRRDLGLPVTRADYVACITCEVSGEMRQRKVRAMVIRKDTLQNFPADVEVAEPQHQTRVKTLRQLAAEYERNPHRFLEMEICM